MRRRGRGVAWMAYPIGFTSYANPSAAFVKVNQDGSAVVWTGAADVGQGSTTALAQIAAEALGIPLDRITMVTSDTLQTPMDLGSVASRVTYIAGNAIMRACAQARQILFEVAAEELGVGAEGLLSRDGWIVVRDLPERRVSLADIARKAEAVKGRPPIGAGSYNPPTTFLDPETGHGKPYNTYVYAAQIAEVEVDTETGQVQVLRLVAVHDCGRAINPLLVEGQIQGGMVMGMGFALTEEMVVQEGRVLNTSFADYLIPTATDVPPMAVDLVEMPDPTGPFGAKGVGEPALLPTAPAIVNAIYDAVGVRIRNLPVTAERVLAALRARDGAPDGGDRTPSGS
ncbi:MAG: nicotinate dehydrogenase medium molybdopterin subunit [Armatimonadota bacterium]|nr:nicotinate dehydrogenase medium molybdopterin subunit [Armatimonadota bacterium]MDR7450631.1 nicotinate dehydrogenase medium molybdopterin subunit [Armatimonadota bacterium]MDR7466236.1 nicotinate dehydrogenase medium molybdopterin subunit [Armatimonadota bacterium]MDR7492957.1 nicotinate dehydrogenase medium molybdopterin subunit [Armatimonadota bacterium]MDR7498286.1 nicotinate dehydrogenase medium molybdopterin subunit [Armatimonadota bacterium]